MILQVDITEEQIAALEACVDVADDPEEAETVDRARDALAAIRQADERNKEFMLGMSKLPPLPPLK